MKKHFFFFGIVVWRRRAQNRKTSCLFWAPFDENMLTVLNFVIKQQLFAHFTSTHTHAAHPCTTASFSSNPKCLQAACAHYGPLCRGTFRHREDGSPRPQHQADRRDGFFEKHRDGRPHRTARRHSSKNTSFNTSSDTQRHYPQIQTNPPPRNGPSLILRWATGAH